MKKETFPLHINHAAVSPYNHENLADYRVKVQEGFFTDGADGLMCNRTWGYGIPGGRG